MRILHCPHLLVLTPMSTHRPTYEHKPVHISSIPHHTHSVGGGGSEAPGGGRWLKWHQNTGREKRCQCITIISPVDPAEKRAQRAKVAVSDTHITPWVECECVRMCMYLWQEVAMGFTLSYMYLHTKLNSSASTPKRVALSTPGFLNVHAVTFGLTLKQSADLEKKQEHSPHKSDTVSTYW